MSLPARRALALLIGTVGGLALSWGIHEARRSPGDEAMQFHDGRRPLAELMDFMGTGKAGLGARRGPRGHLLLTEPVADRLFNFTAQNMVYDPLTYYRRRPMMRMKLRWSEHPDGHWFVRTNSLSLREDTELAHTKPDLRVFVTGDSHVDGVCNNEESFPNRLEQLLAESHPDSSVEVLNAAVGGYSLYNYLGVFERFKEFDMDVFVVTVYGGNDFENVTSPYYFWKGEMRPPWRKTWEKVQAGMEIDRPSMAQGLMSICYFAQHPGLEGPVVEESVRVTRELQRRCQGEGVELLVVYLPSVFEVDPSFRAELWAEMLEVLDYSEHQLSVTQRQADRYLRDITAAGIHAVDLRPGFKASAEDLYWRQDLHLNLAGQRKTAQIVQPYLEAAWERSR